MDGYSVCNSPRRKPRSFLILGDSGSPIVVAVICAGIPPSCLEVAAEGLRRPSCINSIILAVNPSFERLP